LSHIEQVSLPTFVAVMEIIYLMVGGSLLIALIFLGAFFWAAKSGQFEEDFAPAVRILFDDSEPKKEEKKEKSESDGNREV
jgi:cbb3-type cytochrome oxidase maturation protein